MKKPNKLVKLWLKQAENDLKYAEVGFRETDLYSNVCFSSQQAFEKFLKAHLLANKVKPPKTHDLTKLVSRCAELNPELNDFNEAASKLTPYSITTRYPDIGNIIFSKSQAKEALEYTKKLKDFIQRHLEK